MLNTYERRSKLKLATTIISVLVIAGVVLIADHLKSSAKASPLAIANSTQPATTPTNSSGNSSTQSTSGSANTSISGSGYKDGTYNASSSYYVPNGYQQIQVNLTLKNGVIADASIQNSESDPVSASFQQDFASTYKSYVIGQKISGLQLGVIAGASDTTQGFDDALNQIASQAQA